MSDLLDLPACDEKPSRVTRLSGHIEIYPSRVRVLRRPATNGGTESRFRFENPVSKLLFFLWREGIALSVRKVTAARLQRRVEQHRSLVVVFGSLEGTSTTKKTVVAIGPQSSASSSRMLFPSTWAGELTQRDCDLEDIASELQGWLEREPWRYLEWHSYSEFSGREPCADLTQWLRKHCVTELLNEQALPADPVAPVRVRATRRGMGGERPELFLLGAGAYPQAYTLPVLGAFRRYCVTDLNEYLVDRVQRRFRFEYALTSWRTTIPLLRKAKQPVIVIATYHSTHFELAERLLEERPDARIMVEKPPVTTSNQLRGFLDIYRPESIAIGYNRRFAPLTLQAMKILSRCSGPVTLSAHVKEIRLPDDHWYYWPTQGSRIIGNLCHWFDFACCFIDAPVRRITAVSAAENGFDETAINVVYEDGSLLNLVASERGNGLRGVQEYIEVRKGDVTLAIDDFLSLRVQQGRRQRVVRHRLRDKGHLRMYRAFQRCVLDSRPFFYSKQDLARSSTLYLDAVSALSGPQQEERNRV